MAEAQAPRIRTEFPHAVEVHDNVPITLADGTVLRACLWLPVGAEAAPVPAILEYVPYRKGDSYAIDDSVRYPWFAGHGYACVRVDIRGSGDSAGVLLDEYHPQEQLDCLEILRWIAAQPWCTGDIGMMGISWSGFNSLQVAAHDHHVLLDRRPLRGRCPLRRRPPPRLLPAAMGLRDDGVQCPPAGSRARRRGVARDLARAP